jgi:3-oxoacid CoA-transferase subunit A
LIYITGDTHRDFRRVAAFCDTVESTKDDVLIILGDAGINYAGEPKDGMIKRQLSELPITLLCIHGNHEMRPESAGIYEEAMWRGGLVYREPVYPNLLFAKDGEVYELAGKRCIAIGGAYSVDKPLRVANNWGWWPDEQPSEEIKQRVERRLDAEGWNMDIVLSHTCPMKYVPREMFLSGIDQSGVDNGTEIWLDTIEGRLTYDRWYCGHHHTNKSIDKLRFVFGDFLEMRTHE